VNAVEPGAAVRRALAGSPPPPQPVHVVALGKAAPAMADAALRWLEDGRRTASGGIVVAPPGAAPADRGESGAGVLVRVGGDHPIPGAASRRAAAALAGVVDRVGAGDAVLVLLSGGTSSLVGAPVAGVSEADLDALWRLLLESGLDIHAMNAVRRRFTRWGGGRLAVALAGRPVDVLAISDVPGDDPADIGSGPCAADPLTTADVEGLLHSAGLLPRLPPALVTLLREAPPALRTPGRGDPATAAVRTRIVASNRDAVRAAAAHARALGWNVQEAASPLTGDAAATGARTAAALLQTARDHAGARSGRVCLVAGGETTVALGGRGIADDDAAPPGGRCQELALAAARVMAGAAAGPGAALLAAGTDGRDGPTDAAGAVIDGDTWQAIRAAGRDPARDLAMHDSYAALDAAGALLRTGATGTNVMDLVIAAREAGQG
jgi:hydroxypyruvate reductase